jgi:hypothetical protein
VTRDDRSTGRRQGGQALIEFALVIPIFLVILIGMVDVGRAIWANNALANAAREGARYAVVHGGSKSNLCPVGPPAPLTVIPAASSTCPFPSPSREAIRNTTRQFLVGGGGNITVTVCYGTGCSGDTDVPGATNERGTPVTVQVSSRVDTIVGTLLGLGSFDLDATSTMLVNH